MGNYKQQMFPERDLTKKYKISKKNVARLKKPYLIRT